MNSIMNTSLQGIYKGMNQMQESAHNIASHGTVVKTGNLDQLTKELVNIKIQKNQVEASAKVISSTDDMLGRLLDIRA